MKSWIVRIAWTVMGTAIAAGAADQPAGVAIPDTLFGDADPAAGRPAPTTVVAVVEGRDLLQGEIDEIVDRALSMNEGRIPPERLSEFRQMLVQRATEELIVQMILEHEADRRNIAVNREEIERAKGRLPLPPGKSLEEALADQGMTVERLERELTRALKIRSLFDAAVPADDVTDQKVKEYYDTHRERFAVQEQVTARHILVQVPEGSTDAEKAVRKAKAESIRKELIDGGDFGALAKEYSDDPGSKDNGGVYTFHRGQMVKPFEDAAFDRPLDEIGPLVETQFGFHIIQALKREPSRTVDMEEAAPRIRDILQNESRQQAIQAFVRELREKASVKTPAGAGS